MRKTNVVIIMLCIFLVAGCAARSTNDPALKLTWAAEEFNHKENPMAAEELLQESLDIYRKQMNQLGLAETYRQYGLFLRSHAVTKNKEHYKQFGFLDESVRFNNRYEKAIEYLNKSKEIFVSKNMPQRLTDIYLSMAKTYALMDMTTESCNSLEKGKTSFARMKGTRGDTREVGVDDDANYEAYMRVMYSSWGCQPLEMTAGVAVHNKMQ